ncbi:MAG: Crp/Fnr family transcriptional regulator, partial [Gammaproteobacteria bacterium]|nr:Crp/Fnr family transcriptional regulator [Gammaproteobacteria bacterium]
ATAFSPGDPCGGLLFLVKGTVRVFMVSESGREIILYRLEGGELCILTLTTLLQAQDYPVQAVTETDACAVMLPSHYFRKAFAGSPGFQQFIVSRLASRLHDTLTIVHQVAFERLDIRLACLLFRHFQRQEGKPLETTHQQLAQELGTTREVVSRMLKDMEKRQCIRLHRGRIELLNDRHLQRQMSLEENKSDLK